MNAWINNHVFAVLAPTMLCLGSLAISVCSTWLCCALVEFYITTIQNPLSIAVCLLAEVKLPNFEANFRQLLQGSRFNRPNEAIVSTIVRRLPARMIACSSVDQAEDLYEDASLLPGASTKKHLMTQHNLTVNGPLYPRCEGREICSNTWLLGQARGRQICV